MSKVCIPLGALALAEQMRASFLAGAQRRDDAATSIVKSLLPESLITMEPVLGETKWGKAPPGIVTTKIAVASPVGTAAVAGSVFPEHPARSASTAKRPRAVASPFSLALCNKDALLLLIATLPHLLSVFGRLLRLLIV